MADGIRDCLKSLHSFGQELDGLQRMSQGWLEGIQRDIQNLEELEYLTKELIRLDEEGQFSTNLQQYLRKNVLVIEISKAETRLVERHIDRSVSQHQADERRKSLAATGRRDPLT